MSRTFPDRPVVGVGAVVLEGGRVLLVKRGHEPLKGEWSLPGGGVELGETLEDAVRREVLEETGLVVDVGAVVEVLDRVERAPGGAVEYHFVVIDYACRVSGGSLSSASDAADAAWVRVDELASCRLTDKAAAVIQKAVEMARSGITNSSSASTGNIPARQGAR